MHVQAHAVVINLVLRYVVSVLSVLLECSVQIAPNTAVKIVKLLLCVNEMVNVSLDALMDGMVHCVIGIVR